MILSVCFGRTQEVKLLKASSLVNQYRKDGYQVAVVVTDRFEAPLAELRDRYTPVGALDIAKGKAWTAVTFTSDTGDLAMKDGTISGLA